MMVRGASSAPQDIEETQFVCDYIAGQHNRDEFFAKFHPNAMSKGFDPDQDLQSIGIANQTTMLKVPMSVQCALFKGWFVLHIPGQSWVHLICTVCQRWLLSASDKMTLCAPVLHC